jgi:hypothetical protein
MKTIYSILIIILFFNTAWAENEAKKDNPTKGMVKLVIPDPQKTPNRQENDTPQTQHATSPKERKETRQPDIKNILLTYLFEKSKRTYEQMYKTCTETKTRQVIFYAAATITALTLTDTVLLVLKQIGYNPGTLTSIPISIIKYVALGVFYGASYGKKFFNSCMATACTYFQKECRGVVPYLPNNICREIFSHLKRIENSVNQISPSDKEKIQPLLKEVTSFFKKNHGQCFEKPNK